MSDWNDDKPWSELALDDLRRGLAQGSTIDETAAFLCRSFDQVKRKAEELGLIPPDASNSGSQDWPLWSRCFRSDR
jgi:hypothetical protein